MEQDNMEQGMVAEARNMELRSIVERQRSYFGTGVTLPISVRKKYLRRLYEAIKRNEGLLSEALRLDLGKSATEAYMCEIGLTLSEISYIYRRLSRWSRPEYRPTPLNNFPAVSRIVQEPYGVVLVMSPWNYPVLLSLEPLVGAIAAGNCVVVKPSAYSPHTSEVLAHILREVFPAEYVSVIMGGRKENQGLLEQRFDYIFFTGSVRVGKFVMESAARYLTPVTLELGGKSPCIIDSTADLRLAARRLAFGKWVNCGQTCIAPDYVLIERSVHDRFVALLRDEIVRMFYCGDQQTLSEDYGCIINDKHFERLCGLVDDSKVVYGGRRWPERRQIEPTVMDYVEESDAVMQEEIFGPILPILLIDDVSEAKAYIERHEKPLALYLFSTDKSVQRLFMREVSFGGGCINDTIMHIATPYMPFGGVGYSGMGAYHGKQTYQTFSHRKSVVYKPNVLDMPLRYAPYGRWKERIVRWFLR